MRLKSAIAVLSLMTGSSLASPALAQSTTDGAPAFRVPLKDNASSPGVPSAWIWIERVSACSTTCGTGTRTTTYECQDAASYDFATGSYGIPKPAASCEAAIGAAPATSSESCTNYTSCSYDWVKPAPVKTPTAPGRVGCGQVRTQFDPYCRRADGSVLPKSDYSFCQNDRPDYDSVAAGNPDALGYDRTTVDTSSCNSSDHDWKSDAWSSWSSTCSANATHTRSVTCVRRFDNATVADTQCDAASKPAASETQGVYDSCTYDWDLGSWAAYSSTCSASATRTRSVTCKRPDGTAVADTYCTATKPDATETTAQYSSCSYNAINWGNPVYDNTCSATAIKTETAQCQRSDGSTVADSECTSRGIQLSRTTPEANYTGCGYAWQNSAWSGSSSTCSVAATQTRSVSCKRADGTIVSDTSCDAASRPASSQTLPDYSGCGYSQGPITSYGAWSSTCSASATRTEQHSCTRSDGATAADSECTSRGISLSTTSSPTAVYSGCGFNWQNGAWSSSTSTCSASAQQTRAVWCQRSDGTTVGDASCNAATRPTSSQTLADYSTCGYSQGPVVSYGAWSSTCSASATRTAQHSCQRSDGTIVADSECTSRSISLTSAGSPTAVYDSCGYSWQNGAWSASSSTCSASAQQTRSVWCLRSDGTTVGDASCNAATQPSASQTIADYSGCGYSQGPIISYGTWSSTCSASATRTEQHSCARSDSTTAADSECTSRGIGLVTTSAATAVYSGCGYAWNQSTWSATSSQCSASAQQTRSVWCQRADGATVADGNCAGNKPTATQTVADYSGCGYSAGGTPSYGAWASSCSSNTTRNRHYQCIRSDGATVADSECTSRGVAIDNTETGSNYSSCGYSPSYGNWSACTSSTQTRAVTCTRSDGASVDPSFCGVSAPGGVQSQSCSSGPTDCNTLMHGTAADRNFMYNDPLGSYGGTMFGPAPLRGYVNGGGGNYDSQSWTYSGGQCHSSFTLPSAGRYVYCDIPISINGGVWDIQGGGGSTCTAI